MKSLASGRYARRRSAMIAAALCLVSCSAPEPPPGDADAPPPSPQSTEGPATYEATPAAPSTDRITPAGWGPLRIGMTRAEVVSAAGEDANPGAVGGPEPEMCDEFRPESAPEGMLVMIEQDRLTRITLSAGNDVRTERGFGVGDPATAVEESYGASAVITPHKYVPAPARYITVWSTPPDNGNRAEARGLVYEIGPDGLVTHIHAGGPSIQYVEGCL